MTERPRYEARHYKPAGKLAGKTALITGGDSGIGRAVAVLYAREGADVAIACLPAERVDADETRRAVEREGRRCLVLEGDITSLEVCQNLIDRTVAEFGQLDVLVSNAAYQNRKAHIEDITDEEFDRTFKTNVYPFFRLVKAALPHLAPARRSSQPVRRPASRDQSGCRTMPPRKARCIRSQRCSRKCSPNAAFV